MLVPVVVDASRKEWSLLEFQGDLITGEEGEKQLAGLDVGTLRFNANKEITLRIGNHVLAGKAEPLRKGFAVLEKHANEGQTRYKVVGIAKTRVVFKTRPKPVLG